MTVRELIEELEQYPLNQEVKVRVTAKDYEIELEEGHYDDSHVITGSVNIDQNADDIYIHHITYRFKEPYIEIEACIF